MATYDSGIPARFYKMLRCARRLPRQLTRSFTVLAVESSADDTCAAIVGSDRRIHSNIVIKQNHVCALDFGQTIFPTSTLA